MPINITFTQDDNIIREDNIDIEGAGGQPYELPIASEDVLGGVKIGSGLSIDPDTGVLSADAEQYTLPIASADDLGGVKIGEGLSIDESGILSSDLNITSFTMMPNVNYIITLNPTGEAWFGGFLFISNWPNYYSIRRIAFNGDSTVENAQLHGANMTFNFTKLTNNTFRMSVNYFSRNWLMLTKKVLSIEKET